MHNRLPLWRRLMDLVKTMKVFGREDAVSPVIGVILMVAITVILAAVIAVFVFGLAGNIQSTKTVGITASKNAASQIELILQGGTDVDKLVALNVTVDNDHVGPGYGWLVNKSAVGKVMNTGSTTGRLVAVGEFTDGSSQVMVDKTFT